MGEPWVIGVSGRGGSPILSKSPKKNRSKNLKNRRNRKKIGKIGFFLLKMVSNALGTPRNTFKSQKLAKKT